MPAKPRCPGVRREPRPTTRVAERVPLAVPARMSQVQAVRTRRNASSGNNGANPHRAWEETLTTFIVVANAQRARIFCRTGNAEATEIETLTRPERPDETPFLLTSNHRRPSGPTRRATRRRAVAAASNAGAVFFAGEIAAYLRLARISGGIAGFVIAASPAFLALLYSELDPETGELVQRTLTEHLCDATTEAIRQQLERDFSPPVTAS